jgi:predicted dehydrogenase
MEVYGRKGTLVLTSKSVNIGPSSLYLGIGKDEMKEVAPPARYRLAPAEMAQSPAVNVAQAYARYAAAMLAGQAPAPDFGHAVVRHALIDALERSQAESRVIKLGRSSGA